VSHFAPLSALPLTQIWTGVEGRVLEGAHVTFAVIDLAPGTQVPDHRHPNDQIGVLLQGRVRFTIGDETAELEPGGTWRVPGNVNHRVDVGPDGAVVVEAFGPIREDWHAFAIEAPRPPRWPASR
jgi:quercetin dioxygenase-like cupin family protein